MVTIDLNQLNKNVGPAVEYLRSRLDEQVKVKGSRVSLTHTSARAAKLLLRKFLRQLRLQGYSVLTFDSGVIEVRSPGNEKRRRIRPVERAKPSAWETIPDLWYTTPPGMVRPPKETQEGDEADDARTLNYLLQRERLKPFNPKSRGTHFLKAYLAQTLPSLLQEKCSHSADSTFALTLNESTSS